MDNIEAIEKKLWASANTLRANSNYASNSYFLPIMGLIFLRHAYNRYLVVKPQIEASLPSRGGMKRALTKADFSGKGSIYLQEQAQFDHLVQLPDSVDRANAIIHAMELIEGDYETLRGVLPKSEYQLLDNEVLGQLLRTFNDPALIQAKGDVFGRIYEYFLTGFADQKAHDDGEFFTPVSLVQLIVNVIEPNAGRVLDPACGSGGMFVQSAHFVERQNHNATEQLTFFGMEKEPTTIRLAKMNLAVHGLEGNIQKAISYYEDPHELARKGGADFVMANPPFNVDEVDASKIERDPRLPFGLPGVNAGGKVSNGNYLWISYFYSYLSERGRAGFVMSSQASSAGRGEALVRRKLVETGAVDVMVAIRSNFFYTRTVPCELWFFDKAKVALPADARRGPNTVLMLDARNVYRKVTRKIFDFAPEQLANLTSIVWLYRGETQRFLALLAQHLGECRSQAHAALPLLAVYADAAAKLRARCQLVSEHFAPKTEAEHTLHQHTDTFSQQARPLSALVLSPDNDSLHAAATLFAPVADESRTLIKSIEHADKALRQAIDTLEARTKAEQLSWPGREMNALLRALDDARQNAEAPLAACRTAYKHAHWLQEKFPKAELCDVPGLVKLVSREELAANDYSLTPGRYVGVAPEVTDDDFDFEATLRGIHEELQVLNEEAADLAVKISARFEALTL